MERRRLMRVLGKFNKKELPGMFEKLGLESAGSVEGMKRKNKRELLSSLVDNCLEAKVSSSEILRLELSYAVAHCNSHTWKAYQLERLDPTRTSVADIDSQIFSKRLQLYLGDICSFEMVDDLSVSGHCWLCLHMTGGSTLPYTCFIMRSPSTPFLYLAGVRKTHLTALLEALCLTLECVGCVDLELSGRDLNSILDLTLNKYSQGSYASYRLNQVDPNPLLAVAKRRCCHDLRRRDKEEEVSPEEKERRKAVDEAFGTNPPPKLEKFVFKMHVDTPDGTDSIHCKVKFTGSNVLEGVKACVMTDCVSLPIPESLKCMPHRSTNVVSIVETRTMETSEGKCDHTHETRDFTDTEENG